MDLDQQMFGLAAVFAERPKVSFLVQRWAKWSRSVGVCALRACVGTRFVWSVLCAAIWTGSFCGGGVVLLRLVLDAWWRCTAA